MIDLSGFKVFDFNEGMPYVSITNNGLTFNKSVIMKMQYPEYIKLLINEEEKKMAILKCAKDDEKSIQFFKEKANGVLSVRINSKDLISTIARICDWNLNISSYRVNGVYYSEEELTLFDLSDAITII